MLVKRLPLHKPYSFATMEKDFPYIKDTIFQDDNAVLKLISILERGKADFKLSTTIENVVMDAHLKKRENNDFQLSFDIKPEWENFFHMNYFFERPALLVTYGVQILIRNVDVVGFTQTFSNAPIHATVDIKAFRGDTDDNCWRGTKQTAYYKIEEQDFNPWQCGILYDMTTEANQTSPNKNALKLEIDKSTVLFYHITTNENDRYFVFKTINNINHEKFLHIINSVRSALALISGFYMADYAYYVSVRNGDHRSLTYRYEKFNETICTNRPLLDHKPYHDVPESERALTAQQFESLVGLLYHHEDLSRSCILLTQASNLKGISQGCLAAVALETITNKIVNGKGTEKLINDTATASQLKHEMIKALKTVRDKIEKGVYDVFLSKIGRLNERSNAQKLETPFTELGIELDEDEKYCLSCRNLLLHGTLPKPKGEFYKMLTEKELVKIVSNRLIMLSAILLLKKIGYEYKIVDWGYTEVSKLRAILMGKSVLGAGNAFRTIKV